MAEDPEARSQLARLLADESLRHASTEAIQRAIDASSAQLLDGLLAEAAASDDVFDRQSAMGFVDLRLKVLSGVLNEPQASRLRAALEAKIEEW